MQNLFNKVQEKAQASGLMKPQSNDPAHPYGSVPDSTSTGTHHTSAGGHGQVGTTATGQTKPGLSAQLGQLSQNPQFAQLNNQLRNLQHHYVTGSTGPVLKGLQIGITAQKGVALDYDNLSRDTSMLAKEVDGWVRSIPAGDGAGVEGHIEGGIVGGPGSLYDAAPTSTLLNLTNQLSSAQKILSTRILDARAPLKALREVEQQINDRQIRLKEMEKRSAKRGTIVDEVEALRAEIQELSMGIGEKREEALVRSEKAVWEAQAEYARNLLVLSHAGTTLLDLFPSASRPQHLTTAAATTAPIHGAPRSTLTPGAQLSAGEKKDRVRSVEEGVRKSLAGVEGGWKVTVDDGSLVSHTGRISPRPATGNTITGSAHVPAHVPAHVIHEDKSLNADIIGAYPSSHLNNSPAPLPTSPHASFGQGTVGSSAVSPTPLSGGIPTPVHKHHSSFDHPVQSTHQSFGQESALQTDRPAGEVIGDAPSHPTVAETGIPVDGSANGGPGPSSGQLQRRDKPSPGEGVVRLNSLGGEGLQSGGQQGQHTGALPAYGDGFAARASAPEKSGEAYPHVGGPEGLLPPPQHPAVTSGTTGATAGTGIEGMTPREQAEYYYKQHQQQGTAGNSYEQR